MTYNLLLFVTDISFLINGVRSDKKTKSHCDPLAKHSGMAINPARGKLSKRIQDQLSYNDKSLISKKQTITTTTKQKQGPFLSP